MNASGNFKLMGVAILLVAGLAGCDKPGPAETAGKKLDHVVEDAREKMSDTADQATDKLDAQGEKAGVAIDDAEITAKVKAAIFAESGLKALQISVETRKGVVMLSGSVDTQQNSDTARTLASAVSGVHEVENRLMVKKNQ